MRTFFAKQGNKIHNDGLDAVVQWARESIKCDPTPVKIFTARAGEKEAKVICEVTPEGEYVITNGRTLPLKDLIRGKE